MQPISEESHAIAELDAAIALFEQTMDHLGAYMPAIATRLRIHADEMAVRYPDDANSDATS